MIEEIVPMPRKEDRSPVGHDMHAYRPHPPMDPAEGSSTPGRVQDRRNLGRKYDSCHISHNTGAEPHTWMGYGRLSDELDIAPSTYQVASYRRRVEKPG